MDTIYLNIAGFIIKLNLGKTEYQDQRNRLQKTVNNFYKYLITPRSNKADITIKFIQQKLPEILVEKKKNKAYINFF